MHSPKIPLKNKISIALRAMRLGNGPRFASLFVTRKCNCRCPYCKSIDQPFIDITLEKWKAIIDRLHSWGVRIFSLTGGEPLVRPDILEIVEYISKNKKSVAWMISNFKSMDRSMIDKLQRAGLQFLTCSFDSLHGEGDKSKRSALDLLVYTKQKGIIASTLTVVTNENIDHVPAIAREVVSHGILFDMGLFQHVGGAFSPADKILKPKSMSQIKELREFLKKLKIKTGLVSPSLCYLNEDLSLYDTMGWKCPADKDLFLVVNNNGALMPCQEYGSDIGVLDIEGLANPKWRSAKRDAVIACDGCFYGCYYQKCRVTFIDALFDLYAMITV
jgi:MoaA/NifB/PqqE/SkfB family radical SAM enzyme